MKKTISVFLILSTLAMIGWGATRSWRERRRAAELLERSSDLTRYARTVTIWGDDWLGYLVLRSPRFTRALAEKNIGVRWQMEPDFAKRLAGLRDGKCDFAAITLDSYLTNGNSTGWPGAAVFVIDESFGGDAVLAREDIKNIDDLNRPGVRGAFTGLSPSEFLLRSEISHFHLDNLRPGLASSRVDDVDQAYRALQTGKVNFAVLWEPQVTKALREIPGAHVLIDTSKAQGLIIDIALASRRVVAEEPDLAQTVTAAYFAALGEYLGNPDDFTRAAAHDSGKSEDDAKTMLRGIRFATLQDNAQDWLFDARDKNARLAESMRPIQAILRDHQQRVDLTGDDPNTILFRETIQKVARANTGAKAGKPADPPTARRQLGEYYPPLSEAEWNTLSKQVQGTLLDEPIVFRPGQSEIPEDFQTLIREAAPKLANYPNFRVVVDAHVSPGNSPEDDQKLSEERAAAVKQFLMWECHVSEDRILARGRGSSETPAHFPGENQTTWERRARRARIFLVGN